MAYRTASGKPFPYQDHNSSILHHGVVVIADAAVTVDLGISHDNFVVFPTIKRPYVAAAPCKLVEWQYGSKPGSFILYPHLANKFAAEQLASIKLATTVALPACTIGGAGVGKTLTADAVGILTIDGVAVALNDRVLVKNQAAALNNGVYLCTTAGAAGAAFVLTRATDNDATGEVTTGDWVIPTHGTVNAGKGFCISTTGAITVDTTAVTWSEFENTTHVGFLAIVSDPITA